MILRGSLTANKMKKAVDPVEASRGDWAAELDNVGYNP